MWRVLRKIALAFVVLVAVAFVAIQFVPVDRTNPPVTMDIAAPEPVRGFLRNSCYDCHSNETVWPWYSKVAPVSWLVARDVNEGREHLNFSTWDAYSPMERADHLEEMYEEVAEGEMPMAIYLRTHPDAKPTSSDLQSLSAWISTQGSARRTELNTPIDTNQIDDDDDD